MTAADTSTEEWEDTTHTQPPLQNLDERRTRWAHLLRDQHFEPVILDILGDELLKYTNSCVIAPTERVKHTRECALILASAPKIFYAAVEGNLISRMIQDVELQAEYTDIQQRAHHQPSIYVHLLADHEGKAPTPMQYLKIRDAVQEYVSSGGSEQAHLIDNITSPPITLNASMKGHCKYLYTPHTDRSARRIATLERLCTGITSRCSQIAPHLQNTPLPYPPAEVGYALHAHKRLAQHRAHRSSNYIMNLVEDICTHLFRTKALTQHFVMHQFIIYLIFRPSQAAIAEIFCSGLLQCWVDGGGGFNAYPAGRSVASERKVCSEEWQQHEVWAREGSPLEERMEGMRGKAEVWTKALNWEGGDDDGRGAEEDDGGHVQLEDSMDVT
ncbi:hypothetical protein OPT61_g1542 [Boeremia exigua]|uniref:Uncharacterized protein n=1 Tax=Boeremia exigua TaxID=749465 RepID=A0ACC2IPT9_9PLEO|nr:hypothetical protein OPT61_g1542 [Boeremia exigua]